MKRWVRWSLLLWLMGQHAGQAAEGLSIGWTNNFLTISAPWLPGDYVKINYLEAFCRSGSSHQDWKKSTIPHKTSLVQAEESHKKLVLKTLVEPTVEITHVIQASEDEVDFQLEIKNTGDETVDVQWFQPCMRVDGFTGLKQDTYTPRCFIYTEAGLVMLDKLPHTEEAIYKGGQVYVPTNVSTNDVNPRPISAARPVNGLMGCFSADGKYLLANAWSDTQELFQGVIVCVHNDPRIGGLKPHETKHLQGKIYVLKNDPAELLRRYQHDFSGQK